MQSGKFTFSDFTKNDQLHWLKAVNWIDNLCICFIENFTDPNSDSDINTDICTSFFRTIKRFLKLRNLNFSALKLV